jgi:hypothetical protein
MKGIPELQLSHSDAFQRSNIAQRILRPMPGKTGMTLHDSRALPDSTRPLIGEAGGDDEADWTLRR